MHPLREFRKKSNMTQAQLADILKVPRNTLARWEAGMRKISPANVMLVSCVTGIAPAQLRPDLAKIMDRESAA